MVNGTFFAAMSLRTRSREIMLPLLLFPISIPAVVAMVAGNDIDSDWRRVGALLDRVASHLRCGVYYSLSGLIWNDSARGMKRLFPILSVVTAVLLAYALYQALVVAPTDAHQGDVYRIIYYHVPSAWTAFLLFFINFIASIQYLVSRKPSTKSAAKWIVIGIGVVGVIACFLPQVQRMIPTGMRPSAVATTVLAIPAFYFLIGRLFPGPKLDVLAVTSAEVGVVFCTIVLVTGPIWARPVWGIWWAPGDIRLTSTLVLWLIYVSYLVLRRFLEQRADADAGGGAGGVWSAGCAAGLFFDLVLPNAASAAGDRRGRVDGSAHAARAC